MSRGAKDAWKICKLNHPDSVRRDNQFEGSKAVGRGAMYALAPAEFDSFAAKQFGVNRPSAGPEH
jgi:hypothetical protein